MKPFPKFHLKGCQLGYGQVWGSVRIVPVLRKAPTGDIRLHQRGHQKDSVASTYGGANFYSYLPRAFVLNWESDGETVATSETHLQGRGAVSMGRLWKRPKGRKKSLQFLPQSLAIEGFLVQHFKGPNVAWLDYRREVRRGNLGVRVERTVPGWYLAGLREALRLFEFSPRQVGSLLFLDEELINVFVTPHPEDYARLHESLLQDLYADILVHYGYLREHAPHFHLDASRVESLQDLKMAFQAAQESLLSDESFRLSILEGRELESRKLCKAGPFSVIRFVTKLESNHNYCGEVICRSDETVEYMKLYRLSRSQSHRLRMLQALHNADWDLSNAASEVGVASAEQVARQLVNCDLGYLLNPGIWGHLLGPNQRGISWRL